MTKIGRLIKLSPFAIACAIAAPSHASEFSQAIFFGDSLTDTGRLSQQINSHPLAWLIGQAQPSFTTNPDPVWSVILAENFGKKAIAYDPAQPNTTNFAVGGARVSVPVETFGINRTPVSQQIDEYLATTGGRADPNALYSVWVGANDLLAASELSDPMQAVALLRGAANDQAAQIQRLQQAGAQYILVPNIPDVGVTPDFVHDPERSSAATTAANIYNQALYQALQNSGSRVIAANTFALLQEAVKDSTAFGFDNVDTMACTNQSLVSISLSCTAADWQAAADNANDGYAFADGIHPSGRTHRILAQYYQSIIDAPAQIAALPGHLIDDGKNAHTQIHRRLAQLDHHRHSLWVDGAASSDQKPSTVIGMDIAGQDHHTGAYIRHQKQDHTLGAQTSSDTAQVGFGLYHRHDLGNLRLTANVGIDRLDIDTLRHIQWDGAPRQHHASTTGRRAHASIQAGYGFDTPKVSYRPYVGMMTQTLKINALTEDQHRSSTAMRFGDQTQKSILGEIGITLDAAMNDKTRIFGGLGYQHEFHEDDRKITSTLTSIDGYTRGFETPVNVEAKHRTIAHAGASVRFGNTSLNAGISATHQDSDTDIGGFLGLQAKF